MNMRNITPERILIVDDDIDLLMLLERRLIKEGYEVETASSLSEAEELIPSFCPRLILLDININGEDGRQLSWRLKRTQECSDIKVLIMSGYDFSTSRAVLFGADELLTKPLIMEYVLYRISFHLGLATAAEIPVEYTRARRAS